jgi:hypothetical protein
MDYRELLKKYMEHVGDCEGTTFVDWLNEHSRSDVEFTGEEVAELESIREEHFP